MSAIIAGLLILTGGAFAALGGLGILRLPDVLIRMHASTKIGTLGCGLILAGAAVALGDVHTTAVVVATIVFLLLTAPIAAHMIGRAAVSTGVPLWHPATPPAPDNPPEG